MTQGYVGRFAPSPTGPLHAGSLVAALASWLDARAHGGRWLVRIEDVDTPRCVAGAAETILKQLLDCGLVADEEPVWQSNRGAAYQQALDSLIASGRAYPCACSRKDIELALEALGRTPGRHEELVYPGTCRNGLHGKEARSWRFRVEPGVVKWKDRRLGLQSQDLESEVGDFVLKRADGLWAYQLAVVVDDAAQGITDIVRGEDLADNTARQIQLQRALGVPTPRYLHTPLVLAADGEKLSKQNGAQPLDMGDPERCLNDAARVLGLSGPSPAAWVEEWRKRGIKSFVMRAGRITAGQARAFEKWGERFIVPYELKLLDFAQVFGRNAPTVLEIGFGMGEASANIAKLMPQTNFLSCEVHEPGVGALLKRIGEMDLANIRIVQHDAVEVISNMLAPASLAGVHIFFPDPWHKKRHHKRRLIQMALVSQLATRIAPGGYIHCATDWGDYAQQMLEVLSAEPSLENTASGFAPRPDYRPLTKFENRGLKLGHGVWDVVFRRRA